MKYDVHAFAFPPPVDARSRRATGPRSPSRERRLRVAALRASRLMPVAATLIVRAPPSPLSRRARAPSRARRSTTIVDVQPDGSACRETAGATMNVGRPVYTAITRKLTRALAPASLVVVDESAAHAGHVGNPARGDPSAETHFRVEIVSEAFEGKRQVLRHRMIYDALSEEMDNPIHALQLKTKTPSEA